MLERKTNLDEVSSYSCEELNAKNTPIQTSPTHASPQNNCMLSSGVDSDEPNVWFESSLADVCQSTSPCSRCSMRHFQRRSPAATTTGSINWTSRNTAWNTATRSHVCEYKCIGTTMESDRFKRLLNHAGNMLERKTKLDGSIILLVHKPQCKEHYNPNNTNTCKASE